MYHIKKGKMKKIYSRPIMETERLMGEQLLQTPTSLKVLTNPEDEFVDDFDDLLTDQTSLWDDEEDKAQ